MLFETEKDLRIKQLRLIVIVMIVLSIVMTVFTISWLVGYNKIYGDFATVESEVVEQKEVDGIVHDVFQYEVNDNEYKVTADWKSKHNIGDNVKLYYDSNNHLNITESLDSRRIILPIITGIFLISCIALIVIYIWIYLSNRREKLLAILRAEQEDLEGDEE